MLEWWAHSGDDAFATATLETIATPPHAFTPWRDGPRLLELIAELRDPGYHEPGPDAEEIASALESVAAQLFEEGMGSDDLLRMSNMVEDGRAYSAWLEAASHQAIIREIDEVGDTVSNYTSESELDDHASVLRTLAPRAGIPELILERALEKVEERLDEVRLSQTTASDPVVPKSEPPSDEVFDDRALLNLFESLR
jgi:hypothetical protein